MLIYSTWWLEKVLKLSSPRNLSLVYHLIPTTTWWYKYYCCHIIFFLLQWRKLRVRDQVICPSPPARIPSPSFLFHATIWSLFSSTLSPWLVLFQRCENKVSLLCFYKRGELRMFWAGLASTGSEDTKPFEHAPQGRRQKARWRLSVQSHRAPWARGTALESPQMQRGQVPPSACFATYQLPTCVTCLWVRSPSWVR